MKVKRIPPLIAAMLFVTLAVVWADAQGMPKRRPPGKAPKAHAVVFPPEVAKLRTLSLVLGRPTDKSVVVNVLSAETREGYIEYGSDERRLVTRTVLTKFPANTPVDIALEKLERNTRYFYRLQSRKPGEAAFVADTLHSFHTQRAPGSTFTFQIQGDSHPERPQMFDPSLYAQTLRAVAADRPDFYMTIGDDFSIDQPIPADAEAVRQVYLRQRYYLGLAAHSSPLFLVNGNHDLGTDGTPKNIVDLARITRNAFFPQPAPDRFYTGDAKLVEPVGLLRDYFAWTWGDALFVVIDHYSHSPASAGKPRGGGGQRDLWAMTLGDEQYRWFKKTLEESKAKYKFVFAHHVLGTGRGGIEMAGLFEWGGKNRKGIDEFSRQRSTWELPIHRLMAKNGVTIFFQGHDHLFAHQQLDGVVYQELPVPADPNYALSDWASAYRTGDILPNSGRVRVTVSPEKVRVECVRSRLVKDATPAHPDGEIAFRYEIPAKRGSQH